MSINYMVKFISKIMLLGAIIIYTGPAHADQPSVVNSKVTALSGNSYTISATILHNDEGWEHYVNKFDVLDTDGNIIATRILYHPHVHEQPFTRSLSGVKVPAGLKSVVVRAHDLVHGNGENTFTLTLP